MTSRRIDENVTDHRVPSYRFGLAVRTRSDPENSVPLFLSDADGEPDPSEYMAPVRRSRGLRSRPESWPAFWRLQPWQSWWRWFSSDATRDIIVSAKASIVGVLPAPSAAAQPDPSRLTASDIQLKDPTRLQAPANQTRRRPKRHNGRDGTDARGNPTAYQSALPGPRSGRCGAAAAAARSPRHQSRDQAAPPARRLDAGELAALLNRAKGLLTAGDIPPARLLLERAADAQEAGAALLLAQTYDPDVLGTQDARNIIPDPAAARAWYQRAAQLGSADAQRRLSQLQN